MKLLLAEDEVSLSEAVVDILTYHNYQVDAVYDGADALAYARAESYDGMIFDVMMPKLDGFEVLKLLRGEGCRTPHPASDGKSRGGGAHSGVEPGRRRLSAQTL